MKKDYGFPFRKENAVLIFCLLLLWRGFYLASTLFAGLQSLPAQTWQSVARKLAQKKQMLSSPWEWLHRERAETQGTNTKMCLWWKQSAAFSLEGVSSSHHPLHPLQIPTPRLPVRWGNALKDLWNLTAHSALARQTKYLEIKGYF